MKNLNSLDPDHIDIHKKHHAFDSGTIDGLMITRISILYIAVLGATDEFSSFIDSLDANSNGNVGHDT